MGWNGGFFGKYRTWAGRQRILMFPPDNSWSTVESDRVLVESAD